MDGEDHDGEGLVMFCSACGAKVRDTDSFCWKCGAKVGAPEGALDDAGARAVPGPAARDAEAAGRPMRASRTGVMAKSNAKAGGSVAHAAVKMQGTRSVIMVGDDGTLHVSAPKRAGKTGAAPKRAAAKRIDPAAYAGTWRDVHKAVLAAGCTFHEIGRAGQDRVGGWCLKYSLDPKTFPYADPREDRLEIGLSFSGGARILDLADIPQGARARSVRLALRKAYVCDPALMVERTVAIADFLGFKPEQIWEGGVGNHELTDCLADAFGLGGMTASKAGAVHYYSKPNELATKPKKVCLVGTIGSPAVYQAKMDMRAGGEVDVTPL